MSLYPPPLRGILIKPESVTVASGSNAYRSKGILKTGSTHSVLIQDKTSLVKSTATHKIPTVPLSEHISDRIPRELIDYCFSFIQDDAHALGRCSLVCRVWHYLINARRFRKPLTLNVSEGTPKVLALASSPSDPLTRHITDLVARLPYDITTEIQQQLWLDRYVSPLITRARRLRSVVLVNLSISSPRNCAFSTLSVQLADLKHLRRLNLARCKFLNFRELLSVICAPRRLQVLALSEVKVSEWKTNLSTSSFQLSSHLTHLHLYAPIAGRLLHWLSLPKRQVSLKIPTLFLGIPEGIVADHRAAGTFFKSSGQYLKCLHLSLPMGRDISHIDLSENVQLESLSLTHCFIRFRGESSFSEENTDKSAALLSLLRNVNSQNLRRISIDFFNQPEDVLAFPWEILGETLASSLEFPALRRVDIMVEGPEEDRRHVRRRLNALLRRQMLRLAYTTGLNGD